jgi:hypothetical protein
VNSRGTRNFARPDDLQSLSQFRWSVVEMGRKADAVLSKRSIVKCLLFIQPMDPLRLDNSMGRKTSLQNAKK